LPRSSSGRAAALCIRPRQEPRQAGGARASGAGCCRAGAPGRMERSHSRRGGIRERRSAGFPSSTLHDDLTALGSLDDRGLTYRVVVVVSSRATPEPASGQVDLAALASASVAGLQARPARRPVRSSRPSGLGWNDPGYGYDDRARARGHRALRPRSRPAPPACSVWPHWLGHGYAALERARPRDEPRGRSLTTSGWIAYSAARGSGGVGGPEHTACRDQQPLSPWERGSHPGQLDRLDVPRRHGGVMWNSATSGGSTTVTRAAGRCAEPAPARRLRFASS